MARPGIMPTSRQRNAARSRRMRRRSPPGPATRMRRAAVSTWHAIPVAAAGGRPGGQDGWPWMIVRIQRESGKFSSARTERGAAGQARAPVHRGEQAAAKAGYPRFFLRAGIAAMPPYRHLGYRVMPRRRNRCRCCSCQGPGRTGKLILAFGAFPPRSVAKAAPVPVFWRPGRRAKLPRPFGGVCMSVAS